MQNSIILQNNSDILINIFYDNSHIIGQNGQFLEHYINGK